MNDKTPQPETYAPGYGELIRAHRVYVGLSQHGMAARLNRSRRDYQRIETERDLCPPGFMTKVEAITDQFDATVDLIIAKAQQENGVKVLVTMESANAGGQWEFERNAAGRAAVIASNDPEIPPITLSIVKDDTERTA